MFTAIATFERKVMLEKKKERRAMAKEQGRYRGRQEAKKPANLPKPVRRSKCREIASFGELVRICGYSRPTVYKWLKSSGVKA